MNRNQTLPNTKTYVTAAAITDDVATEIVAAKAGLAFHITGGWITNSDATVGTDVSLLCGSTLKAIGHAAAVNGGFVIQTGGLIPGEVNTAWNIDCGTTSATVLVTLVGFWAPLV